MENNKMLEKYKYEIVNNNQSLNILKIITITNNTVCDYVTINIYDLTDGTKVFYSVQINI
ncbi:hypothetical protein [Clostridium butyricum]